MPGILLIFSQAAKQYLPKIAYIPRDYRGASISKNRSFSSGIIKETKYMEKTRWHERCMPLFFPAR
jgi:hypothetical protein